MWILLFMYNLKRKTRVRTVRSYMFDNKSRMPLFVLWSPSADFVIIKHFKGKVVQFMYEYFKVHQRTCVTSIRFDFYIIICKYATFWHLVVMFDVSSQKEHQIHYPFVFMWYFKSKFLSFATSFLIGMSRKIKSN
jgi:hypothetical protein